MAGVFPFDDSFPSQNLAGYDSDVPCADGRIDDGPRRPCYGVVALPDTVPHYVVDTLGSSGFRGPFDLVSVVESSNSTTTTTTTVEEVFVVVPPQEDGSLDPVSPVPIPASAGLLLLAISLAFLIRKAPTPWLPPRPLRGRTKPRAGY